MADHELNPRDWRDIQVLRAQGVLAEVHVVDLDEADQGLRAYAEVTGTPSHEVARQVCDRELTIDRELCVTATQRAKQAELMARSENAIERARTAYLHLANTYDRIADRRETDARNAGCMNPDERAQIARRRADAERRDAQQLRRAAEPPPKTP